MDTGTQAELLAANLTMDEIREYLGVNSIAYLELDRLIDATGAAGAGFCTACLNGEYPVEIPDDIGRDVLGERQDDQGSAFISVSQMELGQ
jgi:amidophosphoribosyltransferase